jgi:hypothetical protein
MLVQKAAALTADVRFAELTLGIGTIFSSPQSLPNAIRNQVTHEDLAAPEYL